MITCRSVVCVCKEVQGKERITWVSPVTMGTAPTNGGRAPGVVEGSLRGPRTPTDEHFSTAITEDTDEGERRSGDKKGCYRVEGGLDRYGH